MHAHSEVNGCVGHEWLEATLESIADAVIVTDVSGAVAAMNAAAERLTGWALHEVRSKSIEDVMVLRRRSSGEGLECPVFEILRGGAPRNEDALPDDAVLLRRDGTTVSIADSVAELRDPTGSLSGAVMVFRDVTARVHDLERLAFLSHASVEMNASLDYKVTLSTVARIAVPTVADGCAVVMVNGSDVTALGTAHVDADKAERLRAHYAVRRRHASMPVIERGAPILVPEVDDAFLSRIGEDCRELLEALAVTSYLGVPLKQGATTIGAIVMVSSGRRFDASDLDVAVALAERAAIAVEHARLFEELAVARAEADVRRSEAERANRAKDEFLAVLGHELRNPLAPITTALDLMKLKSSDSLERVIVERQVKHLTRLVDDLLDLSRITGAKLVVAKERIDLAEVIANGVDLAGPLIERNRQHLSVAIGHELWVDGDPVRLAQVIANLLGNAAKYSDAGSPIWIEAERQHDEIVVTVRDHGIGIDASILPRVFEPFVQQPQGLDRADGGLGLGLAIVRGIVTVHGGRVCAYSDGPGRGAEIVVRLPARGRPSMDPVLDAVPDVPVHHPPRCVLVVDDNEDARLLLVELLHRLGYDPVSAGDPLSALELARRARPVIALLDIGLPGIDGYELARRLRDQDGAGALKLVALTGYGRESDRARASAAGFDLHLVKPVTAQILESTLDSLTDATRDIHAR
jgi:PAS domain S-box-containing protein